MIDWGVTFRFVGMVAVGKALSYHFGPYFPPDYQHAPLLVAGGIALIIFNVFDVPYVLEIEATRTRIEIKAWLDNTKQDRPFDPYWLDPQVPPPLSTPRR